ncbi:sugar MFS transporter [Alteromonas sp. ALT199]|uniref:sugar MFS transporter n=1 Tax=unclassified Alteromonas TaxID=2614992 RepID=UPI0020372F42|nr:sugar MFS transporter [Alteromonas sp. ALT199]
MHIPSNANATSPSSQTNHFAFAAMTTLFFLWGFITALNDILIPHLKAAFSLSYTQAMLVQFCFFGAYFVVSPFAGKLIERIGYTNGIITGLCTIATGCLIFYPASELGFYFVFLLGLFILASGVAILQVSANPYVAILGSEKTAASRLNLAQGINSLGHTLAPLFGAFLIFGAVHQETSAESVQLPYFILAIATLCIAVGFKFLKLPQIKSHQATQASSEVSLLSQKNLILGAIGIFLYVGAEVTIGSFLVNYFSQPDIGNMSEKAASSMVSYYWGGAMIGRFVGAALTRVVKPVYVLVTNALAAVVLLFTTMNTTGDLAMWSVIGVGFFNSIMFPTIFSLAIKGLGPLTGRGSGLLCQAIVGGAILPLIQGAVADFTSVQASFIVPVAAYIYIGFYAMYVKKSESEG